MADKVIVSNRDMLRQKYGASGLTSIENAVSRMIAADKTRGIITELIYIDNKSDMTRVRGVPVVGPQDEKGAKEAIDAIAKHLDPAYLVLLDGPDVVPHISLDNPLSEDGDLDVPSDLPYASNANYSRQLKDFLSVTRVVSRLPGLVGGKKAAFLTKLLGRCAAHKPRPPKAYGSYFGLSADTWKISTQMSLSQVFGNHTAVKLSPTQCHPAIDHDLSNLAHFINCHGAAIRPEFYGERAKKYPVAMESKKIASWIKKGTVVTAECCYGAQLYDNTLVMRDQPICMSYLENGAIGFVGSTNISYGPSMSNGAADLLTQLFWVEVLKGASLGRAFLQARQNFVLRERMSDPVNLKTLGQFILLADASVHPCITPANATGNGVAGEVNEGSQRKANRLLLASKGQSIESSASAIGERIGVEDAFSGYAALLARVRDLAKEHGLINPKLTTYTVSGGEAFLKSSKEMHTTPLVTVAVGVTRSAQDVAKTTLEDTDSRLPEIRVLVAHSLDQEGHQGIAFLRHYESH